MPAMLSDGQPRKEERVRAHLEERVAIAAPPEAVFAAVADWEGRSGSGSSP